MSGLEWRNMREHLDEVSALMAVSWAENAELPLDYSREFLTSCYEYPGKLPSSALGLYVGGRLVGFAGGLPRRFALAGRELDILLVTFLTVVPELKEKGIGHFILVELLRWAKKAGYQGSVHFCVTGSKSNGVTQSALQAEGAPPAHIFDVQYLMAVPRALPDLPPPTDAAAPPLLVRGAAALAPTQPFSRLWSAAEAEWECRTRLGAVSEVLEVGGRSGMLAGYVVGVADQARTRCLFVEDVFWGALEPAEQQELGRRLLARAAAGGAKLAVVPLLGCADVEPFKKIGFRRSPRLLHAYLGAWDGPGAPAGATMPSVYLEVL